MHPNGGYVREGPSQSAVLVSKAAIGDENQLAGVAVFEIARSSRGLVWADDIDCSRCDPTTTSRQSGAAYKCCVSVIVLASIS
jgi:hypothetical protein